MLVAVGTVAEKGKGKLTCRHSAMVQRALTDPSAPSGWLAPASKSLLSGLWVDTGVCPWLELPGVADGFRKSLSCSHHKVAQGTRPPKVVFPPS